MVADTIHGSIHEAWWAGPMVCWGWGGSDGDDVKCGGCDWESKVVPHGPWCLLPPLCRITFPMKPAVQRSCLMRCIKITGAEWLLVYVELEILAQLWSVFAKRCLLLRFFSLSLSLPLSDTLLKTNMEAKTASLERKHDPTKHLLGLHDSENLWSHRLCCKEHSDWALYLIGRLDGMHVSQDLGSKVSNNEATCKIISPNYWSQISSAWIPNSIYVALWIRLSRLSANFRFLNVLTSTVHLNWYAYIVIYAWLYMYEQEIYK